MGVVPPWYYMLSCILIVFVILIGVAYLIVTERKGLGMVQLRQGPNKPGFKGLVQPVADGVKLFVKEISFTHYTSFVKFMMGPVILFILAMICWVMYPGSNSFIRLEFGLLLFFCLSSCNVYGVFICGWCCNSRYGMLGAMRAVAQVISYEVVLSTVIFSPLVFVGSFDLMAVREWPVFIFFIMGDIFVLWFIVVLAELNRTPFDFVEGESELVAGYSVEYGGGGFAMIALAEYSNIFFMSMLSSGIFCSGLGLGSFIIGDVVFAICAVAFCYIIIIVRGTLPRYRYDLLMQLCWCILLPLSLCILISFFCLV